LINSKPFRYQTFKEQVPENSLLKHDKQIKMGRKEISGWRLFLPFNEEIFQGNH